MLCAWFVVVVVVCSARGGQTLLADPSSLFYDILGEKNPAKEDVLKAMKGKPGITSTFIFTR
jgi:hypothetical protein